ncbi:MAG: fimbrillin family protein [Parabacteroides sp.]|nr:fimbrillin family protein [Parabacteroides sp.]
MNTKNLNILSLGLLAASLAACTADEVANGEQPDGVLLQPAFHTAAQATRSIVNGTDATAAEDKINAVRLYVAKSDGHTAYDGVGTDGSLGQSVYTCPSSGNQWTGSPVVKLHNATARIFAVSPSNATLTVSSGNMDHSIPVSVPAEQTFNGGNGWECSATDYLYGSANGDAVGDTTSVYASNAAGGYSPSIFLQHALAQVVFRMKSDVNRTPTAYDYVKEIRLHASDNTSIPFLAGTSGKLLIKEGNMSGLAATATLKFNPKSGTPPPVQCGPNNLPSTVGYGLVAPLAAAPSGVSVTVVLGKADGTEMEKDRELTVSTEGFKVQWSRGLKYVYNLILSDRDVSVGQLDVTAWEDVKNGNDVYPDNFTN